MSKFQFILTAFFILCIVTGVVMFATYKGKSSEIVLPTVEVWGTMSSSLFNQFVSDVNANLNDALKVNYTQIPEVSFDRTFIEALARGQGPDALLIPQDLIYRHKDKIIPIPYTALTERDFKNTFIQQAELYLDTNGTLALPLTLDPLVMYWNRDIFTNAGIATFPKYWDEITAAGKKINQKDNNSNIRRSVLSFGEFSNVNHAREILGALFLQAGNPVTQKVSDETTSSFYVKSSIGDDSPTSANAQQAVTFFTKFSNPRDPDYSWNRSLPNSKSAFLSGNLATYVGFASEFSDIRQKNSNIDFDIAPLPQARGGKNLASYGLMYGLSIVRSTKDANGTYSVLKELLTTQAVSIFAKTSYLPPVRRDMIATGSSDPYLSIFYDSALISKGWLDTNIANTSKIFKDIVESITSGKKELREALKDGSDELNMSLQSI